MCGTKMMENEATKQCRTTVKMENHNWKGKSFREIMFFSSS
jgi:hypothetical protein